MADEPPEEFDKDAVGEPEEFDSELAEEIANELTELLESEQFAELSDDMLLDEVGRGEDHRTVHDEMPEEEWELQDHLADIKEQPEDEPIPELVSVDEAMKVIAEAKKKHDEKKAAERRDEVKEVEDVTISDDAQRVAAIGNDQTAAGAVNEAKSDLEAAGTALGQVGESLSAAVQKLQAAAETASGQAAEAGGLLGGEEGAGIQAQGQTLGEQLGNAMQHIGRVDLAAAEASLQQTGLDGVLRQIQALYDAIKAAAGKHQS